MVQDNAYFFSHLCKKETSKHPQNKNKNLTDIVYTDKKNFKKGFIGNCPS